MAAEGREGHGSDRSRDELYRAQTRKPQDPHAELAYGVPKFVSSGSVSTNAETCWEPEGQ